MEYVKLNNGVEMPILGFGVYQIPKEETKEWRFKCDKGRISFD